MKSFTRTQMKWSGLCAIGGLTSLLTWGVSRAQPAATSAPSSSPEVDHHIKGLRADVAMDQHPARMLDAMRSSYDPNLGPDLGIQSAADVDQTEVGAVIRMVVVRLDLLKTYDGRSPADPLLVDRPSAVTRLVRVNGQVQSSLVESSANGAWEVVGMGNTKLAVAIDQVTNGLQRDQGILAKDLFLVKVPGLGLDFLGYSASGKIYLASLYSRSEHGLVAGRPAPAEAVLASLATAAQNVPIMHGPPTGRRRPSP